MTDKHPNGPPRSRGKPDMFRGKDRTVWTVPYDRIFEPFDEMHMKEKKLYRTGGKGNWTTNPKAKQGGRRKGRRG